MAHCCEANCRGNDMGFYDTNESIEKYIEMSAEFDGWKFIEDLKNYLPEGSTVLELGMGEGKDQILLAEAGFISTGSDASQPFIDRWNEQNPGQPAIFLNAIEMNIDQKFDAVYANKVLQHLTADELKESLKNQASVINSGGIVIFSLWYGTDSGDMGGSFYMSHTERSLVEAIPEELEMLSFTRYKEFEENDSFWVVLKKK